MPHYSHLAELIRLARQEATDFGQEYVGTEHLLLALAKMDTRPVGRAMASFGVGYDKLRWEVEPVLRTEPSGLDFTDLPLVPRANWALDRAAARQGDEVTPEDVLIELVEDLETVAYQLIANQGVKPEALASAVRKLKS